MVRLDAYGAQVDSSRAPWHSPRVGTPREITVKYHRWLGWRTMAITMVHGILYIAVWIYTDGHQFAILKER
jgi:hypothetical protein